MENQAARFVGSVPEYYDRGLGPVLFEGWAEFIAERAASLVPMSALELAAGTGIVTRSLRDKLHDDCELLATDLNLPMLDVAQAKFSLEERVRFEQADATGLKYGDASFDLVLCQFGVMFFPDKLRSHAEALRVLRPGGTYLFTLWDSWDANPFARLVHETVARFFPDEPPAFYRVPFHYSNIKEIESLVLSAGFPDVTIEQATLGSKILSAHEFAQGLVFGNPLAEEMEALGGDPAEVCKAVEHTIRTEIGQDLILKILTVEAKKG